MSGDQRLSERAMAPWPLCACLRLALALFMPAMHGADSAPSNPSGFPEFEPVAPSGDLLQFTDGSSIHGRLRAVDPNRGLTWDCPDAQKPVEFKPSHLAWLRFDNPRFVPGQSKPGCRVRFHNGDEVFGKLSAIDSDTVQLESWFGGALQTPRRSVQSITFLSKGYSILYEGPTSPDGWVQGRSPRGWEYRDGSFVATAAGTLGRDFRLSGSSSLAFDLSWNGDFSLILAVYTSVLDRFDYSSSSYMFYLRPGYVTLQRVQAGAGAINLGQAQIPEMGNKSKLRMEIRANQADATLGLLVNERLVQRWKDGAGFLNQGSGAVFFAQLDGPSIRISNIKVAQWEGDFGLDLSTNAPSKEDLIYLINRDKITGTLKNLQTATLSVFAAQTNLDIPLSRVSQICLGNAATNPPSASPWEVRAFFAGGGTISFQLQQWKDGLVTGNSRNFGKLELDPQYLRQLQFNLAAAKSSSDELDESDPDIWELE